MLHSGIATTVLLVATRYLDTRICPICAMQVPSHEVPAIYRDATPAPHGDPVHDGNIGHGQLADCQVQGVLLLQIGGLKVSIVTFFCIFTEKRINGSEPPASLHPPRTTTPRPPRCRRPFLSIINITMINDD